VKFAHPAWLILLVLLPLLGLGAALAARFRHDPWAALVAPRLRHLLLRRGSPLPRWFALILLLAACAAILAALARPQGDDLTRTETATGRNLLIALDLSRSMRVRDVKPDRLSQAKTVIYELLDAMPNERVGLIGFAGSADIYAPLTVDHAAVRETVEQIDESWPPRGGSDLAAAVRLAIDTLRKSGRQNAALVILSDGEQNEGDLAQAVAEAGQSGIYILAVGVGTEDGDYVPNPDFRDNRMIDRAGQPIISRLQPTVLRQLAAATHGHYAVAGSGVDIPAMVKNAIMGLDAFEMEGRARNVAIEFYQWLVLPAIVFLLGSIVADTRWRGVRAAVLTSALLLCPSGARADAVADAKAALRERRYPAARDAYQQLAGGATLPDRRTRYQLGEGTAAYQAGDYQGARSAFSRALLSGDSAVRANSFTGLGNTLFQLGWQSLADAPYPTGAQAAPDLQHFDTLVRQRLAKLKESATPAAATTSGYAGMAALITNWTDAVRHFDSALAEDPLNPQARNNRTSTLTYLQRLEELLQDDLQQTEQSIPPPQPGEGKPDPGKGDPDKQPGGDNPGPKPPADQGKGNPDAKDESNDANPNPGDRSEHNKDGSDPNKDRAGPDESPQQRARRILQENADLEKGPLTPGHHEFRPPEKDW
jgi:Ca-activated chloride channel family protein